jgi:hypothetical protein
VLKKAGGFEITLGMALLKAHLRAVHDLPESMLKPLSKGLAALAVPRYTLISELAWISWSTQRMVAMMARAMMAVAEDDTVQPSNGGASA